MFKGTVSKISSENEALLFIERRIESDDYRGFHASQHNRYTMDGIIGILTLLKKHMPKGDFMQIRTQDLSKRPHNIKGEEVYAKFCDEAKNDFGIGTQDAMRKNLFVDFNRMGFIQRYNKNKKENDPCKKRSTKYVCISKFGNKLIIANDKIDAYYLFSKGVDKLLGGCINTLLNIFKDSDIRSISLYEYMFFVSAVGFESSFETTISECVALIKEYKNLSLAQRKTVIQCLSALLDPKKYKGSKTRKRDFHNWKNEAQQTFMLASQTVYFDQENDHLYLKGETKKRPTATTKYIRSTSEKNNYFKKHGVRKKPGFELHHVVPLAWSESQDHFERLDAWKNMIYIDAYKHAIITQNRNANVIMGFDGDDMTLSDHKGYCIKLKNRDNLAYKAAYQKMMLAYNTVLRKT